MLEIKGSRGRRQITYKQRSRTQEILRSVRRFVLIVVAIIVTLVVVGVVVAWLTSKFGQGGKSTATIPKTGPAIRTPAKPPEDARVNAAVYSITSPVAPGSNTSVNIHTNANARCTIDVKYGNNTVVDSGLMPKVADDYGVVSWSWTVAASAPVGSWPVTVTCANKKNSGVVSPKLVIEQPKS